MKFQNKCLARPPFAVQLVHDFCVRVDLVVGDGIGGALPRQGTFAKGAVLGHNFPAHPPNRHGWTRHHSSPSASSGIVL